VAVNAKGEMLVAIVLRFIVKKKVKFAVNVDINLIRYLID
jgi:hypothetical protein